MRKLLLLYYACVTIINMNAQDTVDISAQVNSMLNASYSFKTDEPQILKIGAADFVLVNFTMHRNKDKTSISANFKNVAGELILKNFQGEISGFIYLPAQQKGYRIEMQNGKINAIEVPASKIIMEKTVDHIPSAEAHEGHAPRYLPIGNNLTASATNLQSKEGSSNVLYLDFDGESVLGMGYNFYQMQNTNASDDQIRLIWEVVAAEYAAFDINVTTERSLYDACPVTNKLMCVFGNNSIGGAAGLSFLNIFGTAKAAMVSISASGLGMECGHVASHETGHSFGLSHDGVAWPDPYVEYYGGNSDWAPVMGSKWGWPYKTWSKGEYTNASQKQDDIAIIGNQTGFRADDYSVKSALIKGAGDSINWQDNNGFIETISDVDTFFFEMTSAGKVHLLIGTAVEHTNLDVEAQLLNASFISIAGSNIAHSRNAEFYVNLPAGKYYLLIKGGAEPLYFNSYSSFGYYEISGAIENNKQAEIDIAVNSINGFETFCGDNVSGSIELKNAGTQNVNGGQLNIYLDGILDSTVVLSSLAASATVLVNNISFTTTGSHTIKAEYIAAPGVQELSLKNNFLTKNYSFNKGIAMQFTTDVTGYNSSKPLWWTINDNNGNTAANSNSITMTVDLGTATQNFCLLKGCYDFSLQGNFDLCNTSYTPYSAGKTYVGGDVVSYNSKVYKAKWWTQKTPGTSDWEYLSSCNSGNYFAALNNVEENLLVSNTLSSQFSSAITVPFCIGSTTASENISNHLLTLYPNPAKDILHVSMPSKINSIHLLGIDGRVIFSKNVNDNSTTLDVSSLSEGVYVISVLSDSKVQTKLLMK